MNEMTRDPQIEAETAAPFVRRDARQFLGYPDGLPGPRAMYRALVMRQAAGS